MTSYQEIKYVKLICVQIIMNAEVYLSILKSYLEVRK